MMSSRYTRILALVVTVTGLALAVNAYSALSEFKDYTVVAEGVVSHRTPTSVMVRLEGAIPGGRARTEITYGLLSGKGPEALPPADGPKYNVGDTVTVVYPPGKPTQARLPESLVPALPPSVGWFGAGLFAVGILSLGWAGRRRRQLGPP